MLGISQVARLRQLSKDLLLDILDALADEMGRPGKLLPEISSANSCGLDCQIGSSDSSYYTLENIQSRD